VENKRFTFSKDERLHSKVLIEDLFANGKSFFNYPFKVIVTHTLSEKLPGVKVLISVSKRNFKKAVDRNQIKRLIREAYRKNKFLLTESANEKMLIIHIAFIYTAKSILSYQEIERKIILILQTIKNQNEVSAD